MQAGRLVPAFSAADEAFADDMLRSMLSGADDPQEQPLSQQMQQQAVAEQQAAEQQQQLLQAQLRDPYQQGPQYLQVPQNPRGVALVEASQNRGSPPGSFVSDPYGDLQRQVRS